MLRPISRKSSSLTRVYTSYRKELVAARPWKKENRAEGPERMLGRISKNARRSEVQKEVHRERVSHGAKSRVPVRMNRAHWVFIAHTCVILRVRIKINGIENPKFGILREIFPPTLEDPQAGDVRPPMFAHISERVRVRFDDRMRGGRVALEFFVDLGEVGGWVCGRRMGGRMGGESKEDGRRRQGGGGARRWNLRFRDRNRR